MQNLLTIEKILILESGEKQHFTATLSNEKDETHRIYSLLWEGWRSEWIRR